MKPVTVKIPIPEGLWKHALSLAIGTIILILFVASWVYSPDGNGYISHNNAPYFVYAMAYAVVAAIVAAGFVGAYFLGKLIVSQFIDMG